MIGGLQLALLVLHVIVSRSQVSDYWRIDRGDEGFFFVLAFSDSGQQADYTPGDTTR